MSFEVQGGHDQRHVAERLREVAELAPQARVVLLGEQADVVAEREQTLEERSRLRPAAGEGVVAAPDLLKGRGPAARPGPAPGALTSVSAEQVRTITPVAAGAGRHPRRGWGG